MTTEEKAKAYDEVLNKLRYFMAIGVDPLITRADVQDFFPELRESEDERIRKELISFVRGMLACHDEPNAERDEKYESWIAWLEKQQNPEVDQHSLPVSDDSSLPTFDESIYHPCTEKSYEKKPAEDRYMEGYLNGINDASKTLKSAVCSEEDEKHVNSLLKRLEGLCRKEFVTTRFAINEDEDWLKNLKDRVQPKQEWSKEDKEIIDYLIDYLESELDSSYTDLDKETFTKEINWLKSLRPQPHWKPSEEMLEALYRVIPENVMEISEDEMLLDKLYQGLKYGRVLSKN